MGKIEQTTFEEWENIYNSLSIGSSRVEDQMFRAIALRQEYRHRIDNASERFTWVFRRDRHHELAKAWDEMAEKLAVACELLNDASDKLRWILDSERRARSGGSDQ